QAEDGIRDFHVTGVQTCALPILKTRWEGAVKRRTWLSPTQKEKASRWLRTPTARRLRVCDGAPLPRSRYFFLVVFFAAFLATFFPAFLVDGTGVLADLLAAFLDAFLTTFVVTFFAALATFFAGAFLPGAFFAGAFLPGAFFAGAFLAADLLEEAFFVVFFADVL